jgi:hypothetical protein
MKILTQRMGMSTFLWKEANGTLSVGQVMTLRFTESKVYLKVVPIGERGEYTYRLHLPEGVHEYKGVAVVEITGNTPGVVHDADTGEFVAEISFSDLDVVGGCLVIFTSLNGVFNETLPGMSEPAPGDRPAPDPQ